MVRAEAGSMWFAIVMACPADPSDLCDYITHRPIAEDDVRKGSKTALLFDVFQPRIGYDDDIICQIES